MTLAFLDDPAPPPPGPERLEAVVVEAHRRRARSRSLGMAGLGILLVLFVAAGLARLPPRGAEVASRAAPAPVPSTAEATPAPPMPGSQPSLPFTDYFGPAPTGAGASVTNSGPASVTAMGGLAAPWCTGSQLTLTTTVVAATSAQGAVFRLLLTNVSESPCTVVANPCGEVHYIVVNASGREVAMSPIPGCAALPIPRLLAPNEELGVDERWNPPFPPAPDRYVARGSWRVGRDLDPLTAASAPFEFT